MKFTTQQQLAIDRSGTVLVAAAAGSGKTAVMTERVLTRIMNGASVERLLVVTFTNAAAQQMQKRIRARILRAAQQAASASDTQLVLRLREQAASVSRANISTLHSFLTGMLRRHFAAAGIDPAYRLMDNTETGVVQHDVMQKLLDDIFEQNDPALLPLITLCGGEDKLTKWVMQLYTIIRAQADPMQWLDDAFAAYTLDTAGLNGSACADYITRFACGELTQRLKEYSALVDLVEDVKPRDILTDEVQRLRAVALSRDYSELSSRLDQMSFERLTWSKPVDEELKAQVKERRDSVIKELVKRLKALTRPLEEEAALLSDAAPAIELLHRIVVDFDSQYAAAKHSMSTLDFSDLEHYALKVLESPEICAEYKQKFDEIFVDEYQDINRVQESILNAVSRGGNVFLVGDVKQSIYRFRLADPKLFMHKYDTFASSAGAVGSNAADAAAGTRIDLNANFRSSDDVIYIINEVFSRIMRRDAAEIEYDGSARLVRGLPYSKGQVELHLGDLDDDGNDADEADETDNEQREDDRSDGDEVTWEEAELEAHIAAARIRELMQSELYSITVEENGEQKTVSRQYRYSDFAVILRSPRPVAGIYAQALAAEGIPSYTDIEGGYIDAVEVAVFLNLLKVIDNRRQDIPLLSVLKSPICGFTADELSLLADTRAELRAEDAEYPPYWEALTSVAGDTTHPLYQKASKAVRLINDACFDAGLYPLEELIGRLLDSTGLLLYAAALPGGAQRTANLNALLQYARSFEQTGSHDVFSFLRFMQNAADTAGLGAAQAGGADVVRILSIHKSKGLEFPVVVLGGICKQFNEMDLRKPLCINADLGVGIKLRTGRTLRDTLFLKATRVKSQRESLAEEMRVLYVGMTRAMDRLIMVGAKHGLRDKISKAHLDPTPSNVLSQKSFVSWLVMALMQSCEGNELLKYIYEPQLSGTPRILIRLHSLPNGGVNASALTKQKYEQWAALAASADCSELKARLDFRYPHIQATRTPSKAGVTALERGMGGEHAPAPQLRPPLFVRGGELTATDRGSALHRVMQDIEPCVHTPQDVKEYIVKLVASGVLTELQADSLSPESICAFFTSPLGARFIAATRRERELEFNLLIPAEELGLDGGERVMVQGVIDCCFVENGEWVLADYKTDRIREGQTLAQAARIHAGQLALYARALEELTGMRVREKHIFFTRAGKSVQL